MDRSRIDCYRVLRELDGAAWSLRDNDDEELAESVAKVEFVVRKVSG